MSMFKKKKEQKSDDRNELEKELDCRDRGEVRSGGGTITTCTRCKSTVHVVILKDGKREIACPICLLVLTAPDHDPEEEWLRKHLGKINDQDA